MKQKTKIIIFLIIIPFFSLLRISQASAAMTYSTVNDCYASGCRKCEYTESYVVCSDSSDPSSSSDSSDSDDQSKYHLGTIGGADKSYGLWGNLGKGDLAGATGAFTKILSNIIGVMTIIAGIWFMFQFIIGGYGYMTAGEEPQKMGNATKKITSSLIGLVVIVAAYAILSLLGSMLGFDFLRLQEIIPKLGPSN